VYLSVKEVFFWSIPKPLVGGSIPLSGTNHGKLRFLVKEKLIMTHNITNFSNSKLLIAPSILAADFGKLGEEIKRVEECGADIIHIDVMDGHFVPNLTLGPPLVAAVRKYSSLPFDVHLMLTNPLNFVQPFADAGADHITFHIECSDDIGNVFDKIKQCGCSAGLSLKPNTSPDKIFKWLDKTAMVLVMTVEPGFGGQSFIRSVLPKIEKIREFISKNSIHSHLEVDGGIDGQTVSDVVSAGANVLVAGSSIFRFSRGIKEAITTLKKAEQYIKR
jgi:ribulose-phosphate 3-epimerase